VLGQQPKGRAASSTIRYDLLLASDSLLPAKNPVVQTSKSELRLKDVCLAKQSKTTGRLAEYCVDLLERHFVALFVLADNVVHTGLHSLLNEAQQVLLVHTRRRVHVRVYLQSAITSPGLTWTGLPHHIRSPDSYMLHG